MTKRIKMMQKYPIIIYDQYFFWVDPSDEQLSHLFWNFEDLVLVSTPSHRRKITYHPLLNSFSHKLISVQDVEHMLQLKVA